MASEGQRQLDGDHGRGRRTHAQVPRRQARAVHPHANANCKKHGKLTNQTIENYMQLLNG